MGWSRQAVACIASVLMTTMLSSGILAAQDNEVAVATPEKPAVITAVPLPEPEEARSGRSTYVELSVLGFRPPIEGSVQAVVRLEDGSSALSRELGRFGLYPNAEFQAQDSSEAQRFIFPVPSDVIIENSGGSINISVNLVLSGTAGKGARIELGNAEIVRR